MAVIRKNNDIPDILPLMNGQDTSLLYINEDVHKIKSHYRDSNFDSVKSNKSLALYDPDITGLLAADEELTISHATYDVSKGIDNVKSSYNDVVTPRKFSLKEKTTTGSSGNLAHGSQAKVTANGDVSHHAKESQIAVEASSPQWGTVSSVAHANPNSMNRDMQEGNNKQPMVNGNVSTERVELSTGMSKDDFVTGSSESRMSPSQKNQSNRSSQNDNVATERTEETKRSTERMELSTGMSKDDFVTGSSESRMSPSQKNQSNRSSQNDNVATERTEETKRSTERMELSTGMSKNEFVTGSSESRMSLSQQNQSNRSSQNDNVATERTEETKRSTERMELSTGMSKDDFVTGSSESRMSLSQQDQSNRSSQNDNVAAERTEETKRSTTIKKSGSFQIRSALDRDSYHSESSSQGSSIAGSADITVPTNGVNEEAQVTSNQEISRHSSRASSKERQGSRPTSTYSNSAPSYMRDTNASHAKRSSRTSERSPSVSSDKPPIYRSTSRTSNNGFRPPSGQVTAVRTSVSSTKRSNSSESQSPPPSPTKGGPSSRSSSTRRSEASARHASPSPNRNSVVSSRSSSVKRGDSFTRESPPPASPTKVSGTPPRAPSIKRSDSGNSVQSPPTSLSMVVPPVRTSSLKSNSVSRSSSASREGRPRKPSQDYTSPVRDSTASVAVSETSVTRTTARNSEASSVSSKPPSRTPSAASKPPSGSSQVSRQSSQKRESLSSTSATPTTSRTSTIERGAGNFVMKHTPGTDGGQRDSSAITPTLKPTTSEDFELSANILSSQKAQLKTNGYSPKPRNFVDTNKTAFTPGQIKSPKFHVDTSQSRTEVRTNPSVTSPNDIVVHSPVSPMDEMRSTVKSGRVGKLILDFKLTPLTGRLFDPASLERNKKQAGSPTRKFKFSVEGIDVPMSPTSNESPATTAAATSVTSVPPGTVPPPPPISPEMLNQIAAASSTTTTTTTVVTTESVVTNESAPGHGPTSPVPAPPPPPPPPPPEFSDGTLMNSLEREKKRGFTYILDDKVVPMMKKRAEDVMASKPHETVEEQVQSKRSSDIIHDHEVTTLREARAKLNKQDRSPGKPMPAPPDYSTATLDNEAVIKVSSDAHKANRASQISSTSTQKSNEGSHVSTSTQKSSTDVKMSGTYQISSTESKRSSIEMQQPSVQKTNGEESKRTNEEEKLSVEKQQPSVNVENSGDKVQKSSNQVSSVTVTSVNVNSSESPEVPQQTTNRDEKAAAAPPGSPVKSQRSPDSAYHSDAQSPGFELGKTLAPSHNNIETSSSSQEVTVQRAAIESSQPGKRGPEQSSHSEARQSFQSETPKPTGQSARESAAAVTAGSIATSSRSHTDLGPPQDTSSPLPASSYQYDGLLTTRTQEDIGPVRNTPRDNTSSSHGTLHTEVISNTSHRQVRNNIEDEQDGKFSVHIQPSQGSHRITVGGSQHSPTYSNISYSPPQDNYNSLPRSEGNYSQRQSTTSSRYYTTVTPGPSSRQGHHGHPPRHQHTPSGLSGSRVVPLKPVSVDISLADRYSSRSPNTRHLQTIHGMSAMAGEVMQPFSQVSSGGGRHYDYSDGRYTAEQYNFSAYEKSTGTRHYNGNGPTPDVDGNSAFNFNSLNVNSNVPPKRKYLKVDESRSNGRVPMYNGDLESYEYHQHSNRSPRYKINSARTTDDVFEDDSIHSEPVNRHQQRHAMHSARRMQKHNAMSRSQPHLNELGQPNSLGEPLYVSVPHSPPRYGTLRSARSETMLAQQSPSGADATLLLPHLEDARSKSRAKYPYHITLKLNQLAGSRPGSSHMSLQKSSRDGYYNSWQSERNQTQSLSGLYGSGGKRPMHTSSVSLVNIELDPRSPTGQQPARYREDGSYSRKENYSYQHQDAQVFNGSLPSSHVESTQVINANVGTPQKMGEKEFFLNIDNLPESERVNNNYIWKTSSNQTNERVNKKQSKQAQFSGKDPDFTMAINQTMTMDYLPKTKKREEPREEPRRHRVQRYEEEIDNYLSPEEDEDERYYNEIPRVERGSYLIKNSIDTTSAPQHFDVVDTDDLDESFAVEDNTNLFHKKYVTRRDNPGYMSDEEEEVYIEKRKQKPAFTNIFERVETTKEEDMVDIPVSYTNTNTSYETSYSKQGNYDRAKKTAAKKPTQRMDRTDYEERVTTSQNQRSDQRSGQRSDQRSGQRSDQRSDQRSEQWSEQWSEQKSEPRMQSSTTERVEITEFDLERLLKGAPAGSVKQTINVEREEEEILGPLPITHADGEESAADGLLNFDTVSEKVELGIVHGKAQLTVKVRCERVVPIRGVDDMFKKSSVIVTRLIDIDMEATRERRHLLENIMAGSSKRTLNQSTGQVRHSGGQKTLNTKDTFQLYKTFMAMAEAEEGQDTKGQMHVEKRLEDERGLPDHAEFDIRMEDVDERVFGEPVEMEFDTDDLERRLESQMMTNGITNGTRLEAMPNGRGHVIKGQDPDTISYRSAASDNSGIIY